MDEEYIFRRFTGIEGENKMTSGATPLRIAIQKSGRLSEESIELISRSGIQISRRGERLKTTASNFPLEILYLRDDDIPEYVANGVADIGIVGDNLVSEYRFGGGEEEKIETLLELGFSRCRLSIAVPKADSYASPKSLTGKTIATTYKNSLAHFLKRHDVSATVREIQGSTELAPGIGLADAICDLVSSGSTLLSHGLKEVEVILDSQAILVGNADLSAAKREILSRLVFRIRSVLRARDSKYILLNVPDESLPAIMKLLPGLRSPAVVPLAEKGWNSVHTVIEESDFWEKIDELKRAGAEGILVSPIEKIIT
ncbi:MAG: ATP phosphoribosyltransferase [Bdellovibrionales bacterium]|nr:ATP phosphoribosyltransferase [Bdellovibrionales bacterium]